MHYYACPSSRLQPNPVLAYVSANLNEQHGWLITAANVQEGDKNMGKHESVPDDDVLSEDDDASSDERVDDYHEVVSDDKHSTRKPRSPCVPIGWYISLNQSSHKHLNAPMPIYAISYAHRVRSMH